MNVLLWILFGAVVGWIGTFLVYLQRPREIIVMVMYGIVGGIGGGWIANVICNESIHTFNIYSVLSATIGATLITWASRVLRYHHQ